MALHVDCPSPKAVFLFGIPIGKLRYFPSHHAKLPGIHLDVIAGQPINPQLIAALEKELGEAVGGTEVYIFQEFCEPLGPKGGSGAISLYTGYSLRSRKVPLLHWKPLPELIKKMNKNRTRLAYLKAWQAQSGAFEQNIRAVEMDHAELNKNTDLPKPH